MRNTRSSALYRQAVVAIAVVILGHAAQAAEECAKALVPDISIIKNDIASRAAFLSTIDQESYETLKSNAGLSGEFSVLDIPFGVKTDYNTFSDGRRKYFEQVQYSTSYKNASSYLLRTLPPEAFKAYTNCLQLQAQQNEGPHIVPLAVTDAAVTVKLIWRSPSGVAKGRIAFDLRGFDEESLKKLPKTILSNSNTDLILARLPNQEARIAVRIRGRADSLVIPLAPIVVPPAKPIGPKEIYLAPPYTTEGDGRFTKNLTCPDGYHVIQGSAKCTSTAPNSSGPLADNQAVGTMSWFCRWSNYSPIGVGLKIEMACARD